MKQGLGVYGALAKVVGVRFDITRHEVHNVGQKLVYMGGFESMTSDFWVLRAGFRRDDELGESFATLGLGFKGPRLRVDYAFEKDINGGSGALHSVDLRLPF
jgi:hypothetical protein